MDLIQAVNGAKRLPPREQCGLEMILKRSLEFEAQLAIVCSVRIASTKDIDIHVKILTNPTNAQFFATKLV